MQTRVINEATIGVITLGKIAELGRQLAFVTDPELAEKQSKKIGTKPETLRAWGNGYVAFDAVISVLGVLAMLQAMRKNRKGAGQAALVQSGTILGYSIYYLLYTLLALKDVKSGSKLINVLASFGHGAAGVIIYRFAQRALK